MLWLMHAHVLALCAVLQVTTGPVHAVIPTPTPAPPPLSIADFEVGRVIGTGSFGRVCIAKHLPSGEVVVIKSISKAGCIKGDHVQHVMDEKRLLSKVSRTQHPFLVNLRGTFQDPTCLHLVLEFVSGGDMFAFLRDLPRRTGEK